MVHLLPEHKTVVVVETHVWETLPKPATSTLTTFLLECFPCDANLLTLGFTFQPRANASRSNLNGLKTPCSCVGAGEDEQNEQLLALHEYFVKSGKVNGARVIWLLPRNSTIQSVLLGILLANASKVDWVTVVMVDRDHGREGSLCGEVLPLLSRDIHVTTCGLNQLLQHPKRRHVALQTGVIWRGCLSVKSRGLSFKGIGLRLTSKDTVVGEGGLSLLDANIQLLRFIAVEQFVAFISYFVGPELAVFCLDRVLYPEAHKFLQFMHTNPKDILIAKQANGKLLAFRINESGRLIATMIKKDDPVLETALLSGSEATQTNGKLTLRVLEFMEESYDSLHVLSSLEDKMSWIEVDLLGNLPRVGPQQDARVREELSLVQEHLNAFEEGQDSTPGPKPSLQLRPATGSARRVNGSSRVARKRGEHMVAMNSTKTPGRSSLRTSVRSSDLPIKPHKRLASENRQFNSTKNRSRKLQRQSSSKEKRASAKSHSGSAKDCKPSANGGEDSNVQAPLRERNLYLLRKLVEAEVGSNNSASQDVVQNTVGYALSILTDHYASDLDVNELCQSQGKA